MDFKSLVSKINQLNDPVEVVQAPELPKSVQLDESAQMRVLAGQTTILAEAKKQADEKVAEEMKVGDTKKTAKGGTVTKTKTGITHKAGPGSYGGSDDKDTDPDADDHPADKKAKKAKKESVEEASDAKKAAQDKFKAMIAKKKGEKKEESVKEAKGKKPDFLDMDKDGDKKEPMKKAVADKKKGAAPKKGVNPFAKKTESAMMPKGKKRPVKESVETKLTFKEMIKLVQESGGQQQIDPVDSALFTWAQRVAAAKFSESTKAEVYAGLIYERNGGVFEMYDVLSETK
jgi:hypothetical protein